MVDIPSDMRYDIHIPRETDEFPSGKKNIGTPPGQKRKSAFGNRDSDYTPSAKGAPANH